MTYFKKFRLLPLLLVSSTIILSPTVSAKQVNTDELDKIAINFAYKKSKKLLKIKKTIDSKSLLNLSDSEEPTMYLKVLDEGWILLSADDDTRPVLAHSEESNVTEANIPPQFKWLVGSYDSHIKKIRKASEKLIKKEFKDQWKELSKETWEFIKNQKRADTEDTLLVENTPEPVPSGNVATYLADDVSLLTAPWGQCGFYNDEVPYDTNSVCQDNHVPVGCVAVAMGEIMKYHNHSFWGTGQHTDSVSNYGALNANFGNTYYDFASMPNALTSSNIDVAQVLSHLGISVDMMYGPNSSGAYDSNVPTALQNYFDYYSSGYLSASSYSASDWSAKLIQSLRQGFPVYYRGTDSSAGGHAFVLAGFVLEGGTEFKVNWGWNGAYNGWYTLNDLSPYVYDFTSSHAAIFNIKPKGVYSDMYENDDEPGVSSFIIPGETQEHHKISPSDDVDWVNFYVDQPGYYQIRTLSSISGADTRLWLYDRNGNVVAYNDDGGSGYLSYIRVYLTGGRHFIYVDSYEHTTQIADYGLQLVKE